jgi:hypothetical protein
MRHFSRGSLLLPRRTRNILSFADLWNILNSMTCWQPDLKNANALDSAKEVMDMWAGQQRLSQLAKWKTA